MEEIELLRLLRLGDRNAFGAIYREYVSGLYAFARRNISVKEDCEEIIQDIFESLWKRHREIQIDNLRAYLYNMVRYKVIKYIQHNAVKRKYAEHYRIFELVYETLDTVQDEEESVQARIQKRIGSLPERCQQAIMLRLTENLSNQEIAKRMNITKKTVENYIIRVITHLRGSFANLSEAG